MAWVGLALLVVWCLGVAVSVAQLLRRRSHDQTAMVPTMDLTDALASLQRSGDEAAHGLPAPQALTLRLEPRLLIAKASDIEDVPRAVLH